MGGQGAADGPWTQFRGDLGQAAGVLVRHPVLPALTAGLIGGAIALQRLDRREHGWAALALALYLVLTGFEGTQQVWFLRAFRHRGMARSEIWRMTLKFLPRFLLMTGGSVVAIEVVLRGLGLTIVSRGPVPHPLPPVLGAWVLADIALTFVLPALALSVRSCRKALRRGFRMLRDTWPRSVFYVLTPGLVLFNVAATRAAGGTVALVLRAAAGAILALWFKGAIVAFYLRLHPAVDDSGAVYADEPASPPRRRA